MGVARTHGHGGRTGRRVGAARSCFTLLLICLLASMAACGDEEKPVAPRELRVWLDAAEGELEFHKKVFAEATRSVKGLSVDLRVIRLADLKPALLGLSSGTPQPDLCLIASDWIGELVRHDLLVPRPLPEGRYLPVAEETVRYGGRSWAAPASLSVVALLRNRRLVPAAPATWEELEAMGGAAGPSPTGGAIAGPSEPSDVATGVASGESPFEAARPVPLVYDAKDFYVHGAFFFAFGGRLFDEARRLRVDGAASERSFRWVRSLVGRGLVPASINRAAMVDLFARGKARFAITGSWDVTEFDRSGVDLAVSPVPDLPGGRRPRPFVGSRAWAVTRWCRTPDALGPFLEALQSREVQRRAMDEIGAVPTRRDLVEEAATRPRVGAFLESARRGVAVPNDESMEKVWRVMNWALIRVLDGGASVQETVARVRGELGASAPSETTTAEAPLGGGGRSAP